MCTVGKMPFEASNQGALIMRIIRCTCEFFGGKILVGCCCDIGFRGKFDALPQDLDPEFGELCRCVWPACGVWRVACGVWHVTCNA